MQEHREADDQYVVLVDTTSIDHSEGRGIFRISVKGSSWMSFRLVLGFGKEFSSKFWSRSGAAAVFFFFWQREEQPV